MRAGVLLARGAQDTHTQCAYTPTPLHCPLAPFAVLCSVFVRFFPTPFLRRRSDAGRYVAGVVSARTIVAIGSGAAASAVGSDIAATAVTSRSVGYPVVSPCSHAVGNTWTPPFCMMRATHHTGPVYRASQSSGYRELLGRVIIASQCFDYREAPERMITVIAMSPFVVVLS